MLGDAQEVAHEEAGVEQAGGGGRAKAQEGKAATESYEKRQMLWKSLVDVERRAKGAGYEQAGPGSAVWGHIGLDTEEGNGEGDG